MEAAVGSSYGLAAIDVTSTGYRWFTRAWAALDIKPWRWPGPDAALWTRDGLIAWTMVNDRPGAPVTDASRYNTLVGARSNEDLVHVDDTGIAWNWDSRNERYK